MLLDGRRARGSGIRCSRIDKRCLVVDDLGLKRSYVGFGERMMSDAVPGDVKPILKIWPRPFFPIKSWVEQKNAPKLDELTPTLAAVPWRPSGTPPALSTADIEMSNFLSCRSRMIAPAPRSQRAGVRSDGPA